MTIHVFADSLGLYPSYVVQNVEKFGNIKETLFVNLFPESVIHSERIQLLSGSIRTQKKFVYELPDPVSCIVFHPYQPSCYYFLKFLHKKFPEARICWVFWSFELYNRSSVYKELLDKFSLEFYKRSQNSVTNIVKRTLLYLIPDPLINFFLFLLDKARVTERKYIKSFEWVNEFYSLLYHDYLYLKTHCEVPHIRHEKFAYLSLEKMIPDMHDESPDGDLIMVGHSAGIEGNQYEILTKLSNYTLSGKILLPLAYGNEDYKNEISRYARSKFRNIEIMEKKLPPEEYYQKLKQVGYCILNVKVQQGIGNITALLWYGVKLFLSSRSSTYLDFKQLGMIIYSIEEDLNEDSLKIKLTENEIKTNKNILLHLLNDSKLSEYWGRFK